MNTPTNSEALPLTNCSPFRFEIGKTYETQAGEMVTVLGRTDSKGYECLECSDERYRYDRSTHNSDAGRVTSSHHDYSYPHNFKRENARGDTRRDEAGTQE
jgi:hypothetical protein